ncbi:unnamed protein product [Pleuronectes platessa]|uniref:Uncharacterized protein n=1 Tax=Pleuronectes platessa TaxID=8262 RepID=A0A9N7YX49_PLEPL|nr:unnamed protein product [Pleuronectes platessa]
MSESERSARQYASRLMLQGAGLRRRQGRRVGADVGPIRRGRAEREREAERRVRAARRDGASPGAPGYCPMSLCENTAGDHPEDRHECEMMFAGAGVNVLQKHVISTIQFMSEHGSGRKLRRQLNHSLSACPRATMQTSYHCGPSTLRHTLSAEAPERRPWAQQPTLE